MPSPTRTATTSRTRQSASIASRTPCRSAGRCLFTQPQSTVRGKVAHVDRAWNVPQPIQPGGPKILIGGGGERKTLRLTARYADLWNGFGDPATIRHKLEVLREHCEAVGDRKST